MDAIEFKRQERREEWIGAMIEVVGDARAYLAKPTAAHKRILAAALDEEFWIWQQYRENGMIRSAPHGHLNV